MKGNLKLFIEGYYTQNQEMTSVAFNQDGVSALTDVENIIATLYTADGDVVENSVAMLHTDGSVEVDFIEQGTFWLSVRGSNSLELFATNQITLDGSDFSYDFTTQSSNQKEVEVGVFALYSGDIDGSGTINAIDYAQWESDYNDFATGKYPTDLNGNGNVDVLDYNIYEANIGKSVAYPIGLPKPR